jgi:hypothetical protein
VCDRLTQKLDEVAGLVREQIEAGRQPHPPPTPRVANPGTEVNRARETEATEEVSSGEGALRQPHVGQPGGARAGQEEYSTAATPASTPEANSDPSAATQGRDDADGPGESARGTGVAAPAWNAGRIIDTMARSRNDGREQAAETQQALEAIMAHLESQAASAAPKVDVADIMTRLRDLEEQQQNLQSQFSNNRWSP